MSFVTPAFYNRVFPDGSYRILPWSFTVCRPGTQLAFGVATDHTQVEQRRLDGYEFWSPSPSAESCITFLYKSICLF